MANNQKVENELNLALDINKNELLKSPTLSTGYIADENAWEVIVKYHGDLEGIGNKYSALIEILTDRYAIVTISEDRINQLAEEDEIEYVEKPKNFRLELDEALYEACIENVHNFPQYNLKGDGTLVAIIDSGIDYAHPDFRNEDGSTRIAYIWDQTIDGNPPEGFVFGTEYTRDQINEALSKETRDEMLSVVPSTDIVGHGTAVAGIAGGNGRASDGRYVGAAPEAEFIIVKMGQKGFESFTKNTEIMRALKYVIQKAQEMNKPVAINLSYGNNNGSHDGSSIFEDYIDEWAGRWKNVIAVGTGNEGISGKHTSGYMTNDQIKDIEVFISENEQDVNFQLWKEYEDDIEIELIAPSGQSTGFIKQLLGTQRFRLDFTDILLYYGKPSPINKAQQIYIEMVPVGNTLTEGKWTIRLKANDVVTGRYDIWLPSGVRTSADTVFAQPTTDTTLTIPSTANNVISVGAYNSTINSIAPFSGRGYTRTDNMVKPDIVAPGVGIMTARSEGGYSPVSGTSFATPFVTGSAALLMQYGIVQGNDPFLYGEKVKAFLISGAKRDKPNLDYPNNVWGYGTLCLQNTMEVMSRSGYYRQRIEENADMNRRKSEFNRNPYATSEEFVDIIGKYYPETIEEDIKKYGAVGYQLLNQRYAVFYVPLEGRSCDTVYKKVRFSKVPDAYGLAGLKSLEAAGISPIYTLPHLGYKGEGIMIGVIDTGIDYTHPAFINEDGLSKILYIWDQSGEGKTPKRYEFGAEYSREEINEAIQSEDPYSIVPQKDEIGHGTFVAGVAAGNFIETESFSGAAPDASLIVVKLKEAKKCVRNYYIIPEGVPAYQGNDIMLAIRYLLDKSEELNKPVIIMFNGETNMGAHDGSSILENYFDLLSIIDKKIDVLPSGNEGDKKHHYRGDFFEVEDKQRDILINVEDGNKGFMLTMWNDTPDILTVEILSPNGISTDIIPFVKFQKQEIILAKERTEVLVEYDVPEELTGNQATYVRLRNPTPGVWTIRIYANYVVNGVFDCYLPIESFLNKDARFINPDPYFTCTDPGTATNVITMGAYNDVSGELYPASGRGLSRSNNIKPDLVAPGVNIKGPLPGGKYGTMTGTSAANSIAAGACALLLEWGVIDGNDPSINTITARNYLIAGTTRKDDLTYPNRDWGFGELNLYQTFEKIQNR